MSSYELHCGDCLEVMRKMEANSIDTIITDPPYGLSFMGKDWDRGVPGVPYWAEALRVAKPGAVLLAFGGTRTYHRLAVAIEDAGWEIRDCIMWVYGSGFPKSADISKLIDKAAGAENIIGYQPDRWTGKGSSLNFSTDRPQAQCKITAPVTEDARTWHGYGTALKPAWEPIIVAMKPLDGTFANNALVHGVAGLDIDGARVPITDGATMARNNVPGSNGWKNSSGGPNRAALEGEPSGRWPANFIHDGSDEVMGLFPTTTSGMMQPGQMRQASIGKGGYGDGFPNEATAAGTYGDTGSAARFFYCAKASPEERNMGLQRFAPQTTSDGRQTPIDNAYQRGQTQRKNHHPTVKSLELMRYLCRLTRTPTGGIVFDPFMGSGSTGAAAIYEGRDFIGADLNPDYVEIARARIEYAQGGMSLEFKPIAGGGNLEELPLFAGIEAN